MSQSTVMRKSMYALWLCAVSVCVGLNWTALQVVAWTGMTMANARTMDLSVAVEKAIGGQKTCVICRLLDHKQKKMADSPLGLHSGSEIEAVFKDNKLVLDRLQNFKVCIVIFVSPVTNTASPPMPPPEWSA